MEETEKKKKVAEKDDSMCNYMRGVILVMALMVINIPNHSGGKNTIITKQ